MSLVMRKPAFCTETMDACMKKYKPHAFLRSLTKTPADKNTRNLHIFSLDKNT